MNNKKCQTKQSKLLGQQEKTNETEPTTEILVKQDGVVEVTNNQGFDNSISAQSSTNVNYDFASNPNNN